MLNGLGIDIVDLTRNEFDDLNFAKRFMTKNEYAIFLSKDSELGKRNYMACIWSLKEAIIKATNHEFIFSDIDVALTSEAPVCNLKGHKLFLSVTFEKTLIVAIAIGFKD